MNKKNHNESLRLPGIRSVRGQASFEMIMIIAASLMLVALTAYFLMNNILAPQTKQLGNQSDQIKDYKKQLQQQTQGLGALGAGGAQGGAPAQGGQIPTSTPTPTATPNPPAAPTQAPTATPFPTPTPTTVPTSIPTDVLTAEPSATPTPTTVTTPLASVTATPTPSPTPTASSTPAPTFNPNTASCVPADQGCGAMPGSLACCAGYSCQLSGFSTICKPIGTPAPTPTPGATSNPFACPSPKPTTCTRDYTPVCGTDGKTYSNACNACAAGTTIAYQGECQNGGQATPTGKPSASPTANPSPTSTPNPSPSGAPYRFLTLKSGSCSTHAATAGQLFQCPSGKVAIGIADNSAPTGPFETFTCCTFQDGSTPALVNSCIENAWEVAPRSAGCEARGLPGEKTFIGGGRFDSNGRLTHALCCSLQVGTKAVRVGNGQSIFNHAQTMSPNQAQCQQPPTFLSSGKNTMMWSFLHDGNNDGNVDTIQCASATVSS